MRAILIFLCVQFYLLTPILGISAETSNRVVALVQDDVITLYELDNRMEEFTGQTVEEIRARGEEYLSNARKDVLDLLIDERLTMEKVKELEITISKDEVEMSIENIRKSNEMTHEEFLAQLVKEGLTYDKLYQRIQADLERRKLIGWEVQSKIVISDEDIERYYRENSEKYQMPAEAEIAGIFLMTSDDNPKVMEELTQKGNDILNKLADGESFEDLAKKYSEGPGAEEGGSLGSFKLSQIDDDLLNIINNLNEGEVSGLIIRDKSIQIIKLLKRKDAGWVPLDKVEDEIYEVLFSVEIDKRYKSWFNGLRSRSFIKKLL
jgi:peptidyl-prolyl cis-trans isomerase SurA